MQKPNSAGGNVRSRMRSLKQQTPTTKPRRNGSGNTSKPTTSNGLQRVRNKHLAIVAACLIGFVSYIPWSTHHVTTFKLAEACKDVEYTRQMLGRWGCTETSECTPREIGLTGSFDVATALSWHHCEHIDAPLAPHDLIIMAFHAIAPEMPDPDMFESPPLQTAEAE